MTYKVYVEVGRLYELTGEMEPKYIQLSPIGIE